MTEDTIKELVAAAVQEQALFTWEKIILQILEWPFLLFLLVLLVAIIFRRKISALLERGHIEISWGKDKHIRLGDLSESIDQELDPIREELEGLKTELAARVAETVDAEENKVTGAMSEEELKVARDRTYRALRAPKFKWRTIEKLAAFSRTSEDQILEFLAEDNNVVLGSDKAGRRLAKLKSRV